MNQIARTVLSLAWIGLVLFVGYRLSRELDQEAFLWQAPEHGYLALGLIGGVLFTLPMVYLLYDYFPEIRGLRAAWRRATVVTLMPMVGKYIPGKIWAFAGFMAYAKRFLDIRPLDAGLFQVHTQVVSLSATTCLSIIGLLVFHAQLDDALLWKLFWSISGLALFLLVSIFLLNKQARRSWHKYAPNKIYSHTLIFCIQKSARALALLAFVLAFLPLGEHGAEIVFAFIIAMQLGALAFFTPAGIGVTEGAYVALLHGVMPLELAVQVALIARVWQTGTDLSLAAWGYFNQIGVRS